MPQMSQCRACVIIPLWSVKYFIKLVFQPLRSILQHNPCSIGIQHKLYVCMCLFECMVHRVGYSREASPLGSRSGQSTNAHFKVWVEPLIERLSSSKRPLSPVSDVTGHFHTPTLFNTLFFLSLHLTCVGHNATVLLLLVVWAIHMDVWWQQSLIWGRTLRE